MRVPDPDTLREKQAELLEIWLQNEAIPYIQQLLTDAQKRLGRHAVKLVDTDYSTTVRVEGGERLSDDINYERNTRRTERFPELVELRRFMSDAIWDFGMVLGVIEPYGATK